MVDGGRFSAALFAFTSLCCSLIEATKRLKVRVIARVKVEVEVEVEARTKAKRD